MPLLASILAVCLVAGAMLSVAHVQPGHPGPPRRTPRPRRADPRRVAGTEDHARPPRRPPTLTRPSATRAEPFRQPLGLGPRPTTGPTTGRTRPTVPHVDPGLTRCPALSPAGDTATMAFRPTGVNRGGAFIVTRWNRRMLFRRAGRAGAGAGRLRGRLERAPRRTSTRRPSAPTRTRTASRSPTRFVLGPVPQRPRRWPAGGPASSSRSARRMGTGWSRSARRVPRPPWRSPADR